jgi:hypothetical protein
MRGTPSARELAALLRLHRSGREWRGNRLSCRYSDTSCRLQLGPRSRERGVETSTRIRRRSTAAPSHRSSRRIKDLTATLGDKRRFSFRLFQGADRDGKASAPQSKGENEMRMNKFVGKMFLKVDDIKASGPTRKTITEVSEGNFDKADLTFNDGTLLSSNKPNCSVLAHAYGMESDDWIGKEIELYLGEITFGGEPQAVILVKPISPPIAPPKPGFGDEITF